MTRKTRHPLEDRIMRLDLDRLDAELSQMDEESALLVRGVLKDAEVSPDASSALRWAVGWYRNTRHIVDEAEVAALDPLKPFNTVGAVCNQNTRLYPHKAPGYGINTPLTLKVKPCGHCMKKIGLEEQ